MLLSQILYENDQILALNKPSGIPSVPLSQQETETAVGTALAYLPTLAKIGEKRLEPAILHRLDTSTSGILVFAKTQSEWIRLKKIWKLPPPDGVKKVYRALCKDTRRFSIPELILPKTVEFLLGHDSKSRKKMRVITKKTRKSFIRGKTLPTVTHLLSARQRSGDITDFEVSIETGVMHQIRCILAFLGWPVLGDQIYGGASSSRLWLHAWEMNIPTPKQGRLEIKAPLPEGWQMA